MPFSDKSAVLRMNLAWSPALDERALRKTRDIAHIRPAILPSTYMKPTTSTAGRLADLVVIGVGRTLVLTTKNQSELMLSEPCRHHHRYPYRLADWR